MTGIGDRIKSARKKAGISKDEFALCLNKSVRTVYRYESKDADPSMSVLEEIAGVLNIPLADLLGIKAPNLSHVMLIEVERELGPYRKDEVVLFNVNKISEDEAVMCVGAGEYNANVLCIPKSQWISLFKDGKE